MAEDNIQESKRNIAYQIGVFVFVVLGMLHSSSRVVPLHQYTYGSMMVKSNFNRPRESGVKR